MIRFRSVRDIPGPNDVPDPVPAEPAAPSRSYADALGQVRSGTGTLVKGSGGLGLLLARSGFALARAGMHQLRPATRQRPAVPAVQEPATDRGSRLRIVIGAAILAAVFGGTAAVARNRSRSVPEPATEPPSLRSATNGSAPTSMTTAPATS